MSKKLSKSETEEKIKEFFENVEERNSKEVKKIKRLAASHNIKLKDKRKLFCKKCLSPFSGKEKIRIKSGIKGIECSKCEVVNRYKIK